MSAFRGIVGFELRYYLRRISTWVYFGLFLALGVLLMQLAGGAWDGVQIALGGSGGSVRVNSPYVVAGLTTVLGLFGVLVTAALLGNAVYRDFESGIHPLFFTTPVPRLAYLGGRFAGAFLVNTLILLSVPLGLLLGSVMPWLDPGRFGPTRLASYLQPYLVFLLPNLFLTAALFFALAALTRRMLPNHVGGVFLLVAYLISGQLLADLENQRLASLVDPFGSGAFTLLTRYWTPAERNSLLVPFEGVLLGNRLLWMGVGLLFLGVVAARFRFAHVARERKARPSAAAAEAREAAGPPLPRRLDVPVPARSFGAAARLQQFGSIVRRSFWGIVANRYFFAIVAAGILFMVLVADEANKMYGTTTWPVTYVVLDVLGGTFSLFSVIIVSFYAGELIWAERDVKLNQVFDASPVESWIPLAAKWTALVLMVMVLQASVLLTGVATQAVKGYYDFELGLYLKTLFGLNLVGFVLLSAFIVLVHVLANHKYFAHLIVVLYLVFAAFMGEMGLEHNLYRYNSGSTGLYSDMNGFGPFLTPFAWFKAYWAAWALLFAVVSNLFWVRGQETGAAWRVRLARLRLSRPALAAAGGAALLVVSLGGFIFYNTNVLNAYTTGFEREARQARYEREYKRFEGIPQPRVVGVRVDVEIYPEERDATVSGRYRLVNRTAEAIDSLHVLLLPGVEVRRLAPSGGAREVLVDEEVGYRIYELARPLPPGDSLALDFDLALLTRGFANDVERLEVVRNGTFFNSGALPGIGYEPGAELSADDTRRKHGLEPKERMAPVDDPVARRNNYISRDADWIDFEATVGTAEGQIAIAPGYLQREWTEDGRRYFHYVMDAPILNFFSFLSAEYAVRRDRWTDPEGREVAIEVYHHPGHEYNVERMIEAVKKSLDYFTRSFGPYQHRQVRILEFPRYQAFAQSFPNTIPYSEAIGFIARIEDPEEDVDYPFYVTAHEVAHQWWAHQVIGGNVQGSTLLSETLSQYSAMMVMEEEYGTDQIHRFLRYELDSYLTGRAFEQKKEVPLLKVENQGYIHYNKGALAMYALRDHVGEERLNGALRRYLAAVRFQEPPYTNSLELYAHLKEATPDSLHAVLADLFEHITLYDNRVVEATAAPARGGGFEVTLKLEARKLRADSLGNEAEVPMADWIDVGVFAEAEDGSELGAPLYLRKHRVAAGEQEVRVRVDAEPARAGIDPYHKLVDRNLDDNAAAVRR